MEVVIHFRCCRCGTEFIATSHVARYINPYTREPIKCECGSRDLREVEVLQVG